MNSQRVEEPWSKKLELYIKHMRDTADHQSYLHELSGYHFKKRNTWFGLPSVLIPLIMAPVSLMLEVAEAEELPYINAASFMLTGIFTGIYSFFKYGEKTERHFSFSARYADVVTDIEAELIKERAHRIPADVMIIKTKMCLDNLNNTSPVIPQGILNQERKKRKQSKQYDPISTKDSKDSTPNSENRSTKKTTTSEEKKKNRSNEKIKSHHRKSSQLENGIKLKDVELGEFRTERRESNLTSSFAKD